MRTAFYRCADCGAEFDEPKLYRYREDMNGEGAFQTFTVLACPRCGGETVEPIREETEDADE